MALTWEKFCEHVCDVVHGGGAGGGAGSSSQNILHNWDFRNPVNQRGVSGTISTGTYFYDRWIRNSGTVTVNAGYLTMASGAVIEQRIEGLYLAGETVTVSVKVGTSYINGSGTFPTSAGTASITLTGFGTATFGYNANYMFIRLTTDAARNLSACKLELGTVSTLAYDPPMDHAVELPKCQRFYLNIYGAKPAGIAYSTTFAVLFLPTVCPMRTVPTSQADTIKVYHNGSTQTVSIVEFRKFLTGLEIKVQGTFIVNQAVIGEPTTSPHGLTSDL